MSSIHARLIFRCCCALAGMVAFASPSAAQKRVALVIGNSAYVHAGALANPANDARAIAAALQEQGFEALLGLDLDKRNFDGKVRDFSRLMSGADAAVFFYAGHALQVLGRNYLVPIDGELKGERDIDFETIGVDFVLRQMELEREGKTNIVFLDACRDNPLARNLARSMGTRSASVGRGLAQVQAGVGTFIAYSTQPGNVAIDGEGSNSPFTAALSKAIKEPGRNLTAIMIDVRRMVLDATGGRQVPWDHSALTGDFYFHLASAPGMVPRVGPGDSGATGALQDRVQQLEQQLKTDQQQTLSLMRLEQLKERLRQLDEASRADQQRIFDTYRKYDHARDANSRGAMHREISGIQMEMARRASQQKTLRDEIAKLEAEIGPKREAQEASK
jgi:hypothetical protein